MPAKGTHYQIPNRHQVISKDLYKRFIEKHKIEITYEQFTKIIKESNKKIFDIIVEDENGFKLPENLGYVCVIKFKSNKKAINWVDTKKYGKLIYYLNLHSFGYRYHIKWFKAGVCRFAFNEVFKFVPHRNMQKEVSKQIKVHQKVYHEWTKKDFWDSNKLEKLVNKKLKLEK